MSVCVTHPRWLTENRRSLKQFQLLLEPLCTTQHRNTKYSSNIYEPLPTSRWGPRPRPHPWFYGQNHTASCSGRPGIQELFSNVNWGAYCSNCISLWFWITSKHEPQMDHFQHKVGSTCIMEGDSTLVRLCTFEDCMTVWGDGEKLLIQTAQFTNQTGFRFWKAYSVWDNYLWCLLLTIKVLSKNYFQNKGSWINGLV